MKKLLMFIAGFVLFAASFWAAQVLSERLTAAEDAVRTLYGPASAFQACLQGHPIPIQTPGGLVVARCTVAKETDV